MIDYMVVFYVSTDVFIYLDVPSDINVVNIYIISVHLYICCFNYICFCSFDCISGIYGCNFTDSSVHHCVSVESVSINK
jgi:hypothetical protein